MKKLPLVLVADNVRSAHNVGALFRCADGAGIERLILTGISPHPRVENDDRPPHVIARAERAITKTALGAETSLPFSYQADCLEAVRDLKQGGYRIYCLEQARTASNLFKAVMEYPAALVVGQERGGVNPEIMPLADSVIQIPMFGQKDSLNVSLAAAVALFWLRGTYK